MIEPIPNADSNFAVACEMLFSVVGSIEGNSHAKRGTEVGDDALCLFIAVGGSVVEGSDVGDE